MEEVKVGVDDGDDEADEDDEETEGRLIGFDMTVGQAMLGNRPLRRSLIELTKAGVRPVREYACRVNARMRDCIEPASVP